MKLLKVLVAALLLAAMVTPAIAEDRLSLSGEMRVRGFVYDTELDFGDPAVKDLDDDGAWNDQRFRVAGKIAVAEGVAVLFRFDATESDENSSNAVAWGGSNQSAYQYSQRRGDIQFDKAYLEIKKNGITFAAGQMYYGGYGYTKAMMDVVGAGITVKYGDFRLDHVKRLDENAGNNSFGKSNAIGTSIPNDGDVSFTSAKYVFKGDGFSLTPMLAYNADDNSSSVEYELFGFGLAGSVDLGPVHLKGEYNYFDGDREQMWDGAAFVAAENDVKGSQLYLDASMAATDNIRIGLMGFYAEGQAGTNDEQATDMNYDGRVDWAFADYHPESYGYYSTEFVNEFDIFDPAGASAGVTAGQIYGDIKVNEDLSLKLAALIFETEEDKNADVEGYTLNAGFAYALAENTSLRGQVNVLNMEDNDTDDELDTIQAIGGIHVKF